MTGWARDSFDYMRAFTYVSATMLIKFDIDRPCRCASCTTRAYVSSSRRTDTSLIGLATLEEIRLSCFQSGFLDLLNLGLKVRITSLSTSIATVPSTESQDRQAIGYSAEIEAKHWCCWDRQREWILTETPTYSNAPSAHTEYSPAAFGNSPRLARGMPGISRNTAYADSAVSGCSIYFFAFLTGVSTTFLAPKSCDSNPFSFRNLMTASRTTYEEFRSSISAHFAMASLTSSSTRAKIVSFIALILADRVYFVNMARLLLTTLDIPATIYLTPNSPTKRVKHSAGPSQ